MLLLQGRIVAQDRFTSKKTGELFQSVSVYHAMINFENIEEIKEPELTTFEIEIHSIKISLAKIETGQTYLTWMVGICFMLTISIGLGTIWKLFEIVTIMAK